MPIVKTSENGLDKITFQIADLEVKPMVIVPPAENQTLGAWIDANDFIISSSHFDEYYEIQVLECDSCVGDACIQIITDLSIIGAYAFESREYLIDAIVEQCRVWYYG